MRALDCVAALRDAARCTSTLSGTFRRRCDDDRRDQRRLDRDDARICRGGRAATPTTPCAPPPAPCALGLAQRLRRRAAARSHRPSSRARRARDRVAIVAARRLPHGDPPPGEAGRLTASRRDDGIPRYRKWGRTVRWENGTLVRVEEAGEAREEN